MRPRGSREEAKPSNDDSSRLAAIRALGKKGNYMAVRVLLPFLTEPGAPLLKPAG